jgi:hypothetical protein
MTAELFRVSRNPPEPGPKVDSQTSRCWPGLKGVVDGWQILLSFFSKGESDGTHGSE